MARVSRGLIATSNAFGTRMRPSHPGVAAANALARLMAAGPAGPVWRERVDWARILYTGGPDLYGRRIFTQAGQADATYIARVARRAMRGELPNKIGWGHVRQSLVRIYEELDNGVPK